MTLKWEQSKYGESETAVLAPGLRLVINRPVGTKGGPIRKLRVMVFDTALKAEFDDQDTAKDAAVRVAKKWLSQALEQL